jgi:hypothetical protein
MPYQSVVQAAYCDPNNTGAYACICLSEAQRLQLLAAPSCVYLNAHSMLALLSIRLHVLQSATC